MIQAQARGEQVNAPMDEFVDSQTQELDTRVSKESIGPSSGDDPSVTSIGWGVLEMKRFGEG